MNLLKTISDADFFPDKPVLPIVNTAIARTTVRAVLFNADGKIPLVGSTFLVLPGGGMNPGESYEEALRREVKEEIGCDIEIEREIGKTIEYRNRAGVIQESYGYVAKVTKEGLPQTTQVDEIGQQIKWFSIEEALALLDHEFAALADPRYHSYFNIEASRVFLKSLTKK